MAWARERPDGGRGFGISGGHVHWNWGNDNFRKLVLNAIVWAAHARRAVRRACRRVVDRRGARSQPGRAATGRLQPGPRPGAAGPMARGSGSGSIDAIGSRACLGVAGDVRRRLSRGLASVDLARRVEDDHPPSQARRRARRRSGPRSDAVRLRADDLEPDQHRHRPSRPRLGLRSRELSRPQRQAARRRPHPHPRRHRRRRHRPTSRPSSTRAATSTRPWASASSATGSSSPSRRTSSSSPIRRRRQGRQEGSPLHEDRHAAARPLGPHVRLRPRRQALLELRQRPAQRSTTRTASRSSTSPATRSSTTASRIATAWSSAATSTAATSRCSAHNFRNNYEVAVDSFGTLWQSDNDDDGNHGVRINYVMEYGNYGYRDEMTGAGWQTPRTNMEKRDPAAALAPERSRRRAEPAADRRRLADRHLRLRRDAAAEGLPRPGDPLRRRAERRPRRIRSRRTGPGYKAEIVNILDGDRRTTGSGPPTSASPRTARCSSPTGTTPASAATPRASIDRGRIFRVAPPRRASTRSRSSTSRSIDGAIEALKSPNPGGCATSPGRRCTSRATRRRRRCSSSAAADEDPRLRRARCGCSARSTARGSTTSTPRSTTPDPDIRIVGAPPGPRAEGST